MKKGILFAAACCVLLSCEEEVDLRVGNETPVLLMNAQLRTDDTLHTVFLERSLISRLEPCGDAAVTVTLNGTERLEAYASEEADWSGSRPCFRFRADFRPGDRVRLDAVCGEDHAFAEVTFPEAGTIVSTDTVRVDGDVPALALYQFRLRLRDFPGEEDYYRVDMGVRSEADVSYVVEDKEFTKVLRMDHRVSFDASSDPVINEGKVSPEAGEDLFADIIPGNAFSAFTDRLFRDGEYTLRMHASLSSFWYSELSEPDVRQYAVLKLYTMSFAQYRYLRAIDNFETFGYEMSFLVEPTSLPSNVEGGIGFVSAETCVERTIRMPDPPKDIIYY